MRKVAVPLVLVGFWHCLKMCVYVRALSSMLRKSTPYIYNMSTRLEEGRILLLHHEKKDRQYAPDLNSEVQNVRSEFLSVNR